MRFMGVLFLLFALEASSQINGRYGKVYPILEESFLEVIHQRLKNAEKDGTVARVNQTFQEKAFASANRPKPVRGLQVVHPKSVRVFDPTITMPKDILDHRKRVIIKKGTQVNPLDHVSLRRDLLLFDGDDETQVSWAKAQSGESKWILTSGSPFELMDDEGRQVYFDQGGRLTKHFGVRGLPCRITQEGSLLRIEEGRDA